MTKNLTDKKRVKYLTLDQAGGGYDRLLFMGQIQYSFESQGRD